MPAGDIFTGALIASLFFAGGHALLHRRIRFVGFGGRLHRSGQSAQLVGGAYIVVGVLFLAGLIAPAMRGATFGGGVVIFIVGWVLAIFRRGGG